MTTDYRERLLYTLPQACEQLGISLTKLYRLINTGEIKTIKIFERAVRIPAAELEAFIARRIAAANQE